MIGSLPTFAPDAQGRSRSCWPRSVARSRRWRNWFGVRNANGGYENKSFWWSVAFKVDQEPQPALQVTGRRLDGSGSARSAGATNAAASDIGSAMLTGLTLPTAGCWELTGSYRGHDLSFVVWIPDSAPTAVAAPRVVPAPPSCPITTRPDPPFVPPTGFPETPRARYAGMFWYGADDLWTLVNESGAWNQLPNGGDTSVAARDSSGPYEDKGPSMLTGLTVPTSGCWELTGSYREHELSYVVWIPGPED